MIFVQKSKSIEAERRLVLSWERREERGRDQPRMDMKGSGQESRSVRTYLLVMVAQLGKFVLKGELFTWGV